MTKQIALSGVLATLASVCFVAGVALLTIEGGTDTHEQSEGNSINDRAFSKYQN